MVCSTEHLEIDTQSAQTRHQQLFVFIERLNWQLYIYNVPFEGPTDNLRLGDLCGSTVSSLSNHAEPAINNTQLHCPSSIADLSLYPLLPCNSHLYTRKNSSN